MWQKSYSAVYEKVTAQSVWQVWQDVNCWHVWDHDIDYCKLEGPFEAGQYFILKPKGAPEVKIQLIEVTPLTSYTDCTHFFGARMYGYHEMKEEAGGRLRLTTTMTVEGPLGFLWRRLVAQGIVDTLDKQTAELVEVARSHGI